MDEFTKTVKLSFDVDKQNVNEVRSLMKSLQKDGQYEIVGIDPEAINTLRSLIDNMKATSFIDDGRLDKLQSILSDSVMKDQVVDELHDYEEAVAKLADLQGQMARLQQLSSSSANQAKEALQGMIDKQQQIVNNLSSYDFGDFQKLIDTGLITEEAAKQLKSQMDSVSAIETDIKNTSDLISKLSMLNTQQSKDTIRQLDEKIKLLKKMRDDAASGGNGGSGGGGHGSGGGGEEDSKGFGNFRKHVIDYGVLATKHVLESALTSLKSLLADAWDEMENILDFSQLTDSSIREQAFTYGFSQSQNYAYSQTMDLMGFNDFEDLYYMNSQQQEKFQEKFLYYQEKYNKLYDSGYFEQMQDFEWEMAEFKEDMQYEVIQFFMENKDSIKTVMKALIDLSEFVISSLGWLITYFGGKDERSASDRIAATNDIISNYSTSTVSNTNVNVDNTFNNVANKDQQWLANAGEMTYEQIIRALT